jgi:hypothetical protein
MKIRRMRIACWEPKATNTHSEYVLLITFPRQQLLGERNSTICCTYIGCLFDWPIEKNVWISVVTSWKFHLGIQLEALREPTRSPDVTADIRTEDPWSTTCTNHYTKEHQQRLLVYNAVTSVLVASDYFESEEKGNFVMEVAVGLLIFCHRVSQTAL